MHLYKLRRGQGQPLVQRHIGVITTLEHLQEAQGRSASVLDIMTHGEGDVTDISGVKVERSCLTRRSKHAHAALAVEVVLPFIGFRMQCSSRSPPGSTSTRAAAIALEAKNTLESVIRT